MGGCFGHATKRVNCSKKHDGLFMTTYCKNAGEKKKKDVKQTGMGNADDR